MEALRKGLDDYVLKDPRRFMRLPAAVRSAVDHARQRAAARAAELRYHELFDGAPVGLIRCLPDGRDPRGQRGGHPHHGLSRAWPRCWTRAWPISTRTRATGPA